MKKFFVPFLALEALFLAGCGGTATSASISGIVVDQSGNPVRGAEVVCGQSTTTTNSIGAYRLDNVFVGTPTVSATLVQSGKTYRGYQAALTFDGELAKNVNIEVTDPDNQGRIQGTVTDSFGNPLVKAKVFLAAQNGLSSNLVITNSDGFYAFSEAVAGQTYTVRASAQYSNNDSADISVARGQTRTLNLVLRNATNPTLSPPSNLEATAWTSPYFLTRSVSDPRLVDALESVRRLNDPKRANKIATSRAAVPGLNNVEVDISFNPVTSTSLFGYGVYRRLNSGTPVAYLLRDPGASYYVDLDPALLIGQSYTYFMTSLNTSYPSTNNSESNDSNSVTVTPIGGIATLTASPATRPTITWSPASGAAKYIVYVYDRFPGYQIAPVWSNSGSSTTASSLTVGTNLASGQTYYYVVVGLNGDDSSRCISDIKSVTIP